MTEAAERIFERAVVDLAKMNGWLVHNPRPARYQRDWMRGWPDLCLIRIDPNGGVGDTIFAELKTPVGRLSAEQVTLLKHLARSGFECHVWRPNDLQRIADRLAKR